uniref:Uncharacterized protein n=1 Tax=Hyaloperonospora arabidopsidis (strain Emoy2) TaxID=559515 RepID=M4BKQ2_HYAAE
MAVAQAATDADLDSSDWTLERPTTSIKCGIKYAGLLVLDGHLAHDHRMHLLKNVHRGWLGMSRTESASQVRWYLEYYVSSSSKTTDLVLEDTWGTRDTVGLAANFLQQTIYVIQQVDDQQHGWRCSKFVPTTVFHRKPVIETATEHLMTLGVFMDEIVDLKIETPASPPLILRYREQHYFVFIHSGIPNGLSGFEAGTDLLESPARYTANHQVGPNNAPAGTADARTPAKGLAEATILQEALPGRVRSPSDDPAPTAVPSQAIVTVESRLVLPALPVTPPLGSRPAPPPDHKRDLSSSPEHVQLQERWYRTNIQRQS